MALVISRRRAAPSPVLRVSWAASGLSGALAALLRPCGLDLARSGRSCSRSARRSGGPDDLQAARCALAGAAGVLGGLWPLRHPGGAAAALWPQSRPERAQPLPISAAQRWPW